MAAAAMLEKAASALTRWCTRFIPDAYVIAGLLTVVVFAAAGLIEGFVTGSALPTWARLGINLGGEVLLVWWLVTRGRAANRRGLTGALGEASADALA